ncbi:MULTISPECIES: hypothetical protein [unclassified Streptomyces]|uniref:hypothetical protein n=1 Tax=unclassified Streptomyces TaxID=2593676 RepID=UPI002E27AB62|nr:hypothetical protein [Streptomyces sp. NBC_00223]
MLASRTIAHSARISPSVSPPPAPIDAGRTWTITTDEGLSVTGHLPTWAEDDPSESGVPLDRLGAVLGDINHHRDTSGQLLRVRSSPGAFGSTNEKVPVFCGSIDCDPYTPTSALPPSTPTASPNWPQPSGPRRTYWTTKSAPRSSTPATTGRETAPTHPRKARPPTRLYPGRSEATGTRNSQVSDPGEGSDP